MPIFRMLTAVTLAAALMFTPVAEAASKGEIKEQAAHVKRLRKDLRSFNKLVEKWNKTNLKGKDTGKVDAKLSATAKNELAWLREHGQPTKKKELAEGEEEEHPWMARMRDAAVGIREAKSSVEKNTHMSSLQNSMQTRIDRQQRKLEKLEH